MGSDDREGALTIVGAVSPPGGDLSDPVVQSTLRVVKVFWSLEDTLAFRRHFPAISWLNSYSLYYDNIDDYFLQNVGEDFVTMRSEAMKLLQQEADLEEIVRLVGIDAVSEEERLILETSRSLREDFLHQNAFHEVDTYASMEKQYKMLKLILDMHQQSREALKRGATLKHLSELSVNEEIARARYLPESDLAKIDEIKQRIVEQVGSLGQE